MSEAVRHTPAYELLEPGTRAGVDGEYERDARAVRIEEARKARLEADREAKPAANRERRQNAGPLAKCSVCRGDVRVSRNGFVKYHSPAVPETWKGHIPYRCDGVGKRPDAITAPVDAWDLLCDERQNDDVGPELYRRLTAAESFKEGLKERREVLRQCPPMVIDRNGVHVASHAVLHVDDVRLIFADSYQYAAATTIAFLQDHDLGDPMVWAQACLGSALRVPIALEGGCNDMLGRDAPGNAWGRLCDALHFNRRSRRDDYLSSSPEVGGAKAGTYCARHPRKILRELRGEGRAVRALKFSKTPITSWRCAENGEKWPSTGVRYDRRYRPSVTYVTCGAYQEVEKYPELVDWRDAMRKAMDKRFGGRHAWAWVATELARSSRRGITFEEQILQKFDRVAAYRTRAIRRRYLGDRRRGMPRPKKAFKHAPFEKSKPIDESKIAETPEIPLDPTNSHQDNYAPRIKRSERPSTGRAPSGGSSKAQDSPKTCPPADAGCPEERYQGKNLATPMPGAEPRLSFDGRTFGTPAELVRAVVAATRRR